VQPLPSPFSPTTDDGVVAADEREIGRVVATLLFAGGTPAPGDVARANECLIRLGRPALTDGDSAPATPEELAAAIPVQLRGPLSEMLFRLAAGDTLRHRVAESYARLWLLPSALPSEPLPPASAGPPSARPASTMARWLVGALPRHQDTSTAKDRPMLEKVYRNGDPAAQTAPSTTRDPLRDRVERIAEEFRAVVDAVERVLIGKRPTVERALTAMAARGHVLVMDAPGVGKTLLCKAIAAACSVRYGRVQFTPDLMPMDLTGASIYEAHEKRFVFRPGPIFTQFLLADEINRATPKTQSALLEVMEERTVTVDGATYRMADPFQVLATMNPFDHEGTFALPAAQIDRFMVMLELGHPSPDDEVRVLDAHLAPDPVLASMKPVISAESFLRWQRTVPCIHASPALKRAAVDYVGVLRRACHSGQTVSPRATLAWMRAAQARAMLSGREFVTVEDLLDLAGDVFTHRLWVSGAEVRDRLGAMAPRSGAGTP
jgi:MoxR-like ATPase